VVTYVNVATNVIRVDREEFDTTTPGTFSSGAHIAPLVKDPFNNGKDKWVYNFWIGGPRWNNGSSNMNLIETRVEHLHNMITKSKTPDIYQGINFDVLDRNPNRGSDTRSIDINNDRVADNGIIMGVNIMDKGIAEFLKQFRTRMGTNFIITMDGQSIEQGRSVGFTNGIETERFPCGEENNRLLFDWSSGVNRLLFWGEHAQSPKMNYLNHKFNGNHYSNPNFGWNIERASLAMGPMLDFHLTFFKGPPAAPPPPTGDPLDIYDEVDCGTDDIPNWLGASVGPAERLALDTFDLLGGQGYTFPSSFVNQWTFTNATATIMSQIGQPSVLRIAPTGNSLDVEVQLPALNILKGDLVVFCEVRTDAMNGNLQRFRVLEMECNNRVDTYYSPDTAHAWMHTQSYLAEFYWRHAGGPLDTGSGANVQLKFRLPKYQGGKPFYISRLTIHSAQPAMMREFANGIVLVNPSLDPFEFTISPSGPGPAYHRINGSLLQDPYTNNGQSVGNKVTLQGRDGLFLVHD